MLTFKAGWGTSPALDYRCAGGGGVKLPGAAGHRDGRVVPEMEQMKFL